MTYEMLKDGTQIQLRQPSMEDLDRIRRFFVALPVEDRRYLRFDLTQTEAVKSLIRQSESGRAYRILALEGDTVIGHGVLDFPPDGWQRHIGEIRVIVAEDHRGRWLGAHLVGHLVRKAEERGLERVVVKMAEPQMAARRVCSRLGFTVDGLLPDQFKDLEGRLHGLVVMSCPIDQVSASLRDFYREDDWPDG
jgi:RimJ/RimL family protein N-acetyltransferase